ncbi:uncharacterized protein LOC134694132 [Mytilus trossulus]|uniref:uncharacterized protein LOC134694132 n=1 Tax=Mytilus trossulus TaxID=6551 RepID=UPI00300792C3
MPYTQPQENFFKLFTLVYLHGTNISRQLLQMFIDSKRFTFEAFINNHQHELYHFSSNTLCCQCEKNTILPKKLLLDKTQMLIIFDKDSIRIDKHEQQKQGLCCLKANKNVKLDDLDLTFIRFFIVNFCCQIFWECHLQYAKKCISVFLNDNVHKVYHLAFANVCCCKCNNDRDISHQRRITESQFGIIFDTDGKTCHRYCSCQYRIKEGISLSLLIDQDKKLYTEITKYFCSCQKHFEDIIAIRNEIAHASFAFITNDEKLSKLWTATANNILAIANVLGVNDKYEPQLLELKEECSHSYYQKCIIDLIKTSEHFDPAIVQRIDNSTEETKFRVVMACLEEFLSSASNRNVQSVEFVKNEAVSEQHMSYYVNHIHIISRNQMGDRPQN